MSKIIIYVKMINICKKFKNRFWLQICTATADRIHPKNHASLSKNTVEKGKSRKKDNCKV